MPIKDFVEYECSKYGVRLMFFNEDQRYMELAYVTKSMSEKFIDNSFINQFREELHFKIYKKYNKRFKICNLMGHPSDRISNNYDLLNLASKIEESKQLTLIP